jgi:hypothetical protein
MGVEIMCAIVWNSDDRAVLISTTDAAGNVNFWSQPQGESTWPAPQLVGAPLIGQGRFNIYREPTMSWGSNKAPVVIAAVDFLGNLDYLAAWRFGLAPARRRGDRNGRRHSLQ